MAIQNGIRIPWIVQVFFCIGVLSTATLSLGTLVGGCGVKNSSAREEAKAPDPFVATPETLLPPSPRSRSSSGSTTGLSQQPSAPKGTSPGVQADASSGKGNPSLMSRLSEGAVSGLTGAATEAIDKVGDVLQGGTTVFTANMLGKLHVSGMLLILLAFLARVLFGSWKDAAVCIAICAMPSAIGVMLTEYSRVVIIVPAFGIALGIMYLWRTLKIWRVKAKAFETTATAIEATGATAAKKLIASGAVGDSKCVDEALCTIEKKLKGISKPTKKVRSKKAEEETQDGEARSDS